MLQKTKGVILHQLKYSDSSVIVQVYTRELGRLSFIVKGIKHRKSGTHNVFLQPMFILDLVLYYKESRSVQVIKEFSPAYSPTDIYSDVRKSCTAIFLGEIMTAILKEESPHVEMFDFIEASVKYFDSCKTDFANFHIAFLIGLSGYLGFEPGIRLDADNKYFDLQNGAFVPLPPVHGNYADPHISDLLAHFFSSSYDQAGTIPLTGKLRNEILETLIKYFSVHLPGLKKINSLEILKEIFR